MSRHLTAAALACALLAGATACTDARRQGPVSAAASSQTVHLTIDGRVRTYVLHLPPTAGPQPAPLVVVLHGGFGSGKQAEQAYGWDALADRERFAVVYPDGVGRAWNVGDGCCGEPGRTGVDDVAFVRAVVEDVGRAVVVDRLRTYATGISNGGMLAYRLACDSSVFAAVGPVAATLLGPCPDPSPVSVIHVHGLADGRIRYAGGRGEGVAHITGPSVPTVISQWRRVDDCAPPRETTSGAVTVSVASCVDERAVELVTVDGAGHQWPGATYSAAQRRLGLDRPSTALSATDTIWAFFAEHPAPT